MIKKFVLCFFLFLTGCVSTAEETPDLQIVKTDVPFSLTPVAHNKIQYFLKGNETKDCNDMVFYFNQPLAESSIQILLLQNGQPLPLRKKKMPADMKVPYEYEVSGEKLIIHSLDGFPNGIIGVGISKNVQSTAGKKLNRDLYIPFSTSLSNPLTNLQTTSENGVLTLFTRKNDQKTIGYLNAPIYQVLSKKRKFQLVKGNNVEIYGEKGDSYQVRFYLPKKEMNPDQLVIDSHENILTNQYCEIITGEIPKKDMMIIPKPVSEKSEITVMIDDPAAPAPLPSLVFEGFPTGSVSIPLTRELPVISKEMIQAIELQTRIFWDEAYGRKYLLSKQDEKGTQFLETSKEAHYPESFWSKDEYTLFKTFEPLHHQILDQYWEIPDLSKKLSDFNQRLKEKMIRSRNIEHTYIQWGAEKKYPNLNWFFKSLIKQRPDFTQKQLVEKILRESPEAEKYKRALELFVHNEKDTALLREWEDAFQTIIQPIVAKNDDSPLSERQ